MLDKQKTPRRVTCVFVHGWSMNSAVWQGCQALLPEWIDAVFIDLPGHGGMSGVAAESVEDYVKVLAPLVHRPVMWVGWSLGALAVMRLAALYPERVASLFLVAATPCFVRRDDWSTAIEEDVFIQFAESLASQQEKTLSRFMSLQVKGLPEARAIIRQLQAAMAARGETSPAALKTGLDILVNTDYRNLLAELECAVSWYLGGRDTLVPVGVAEEIRSRYSKHDISIAAGAGHIPFVSHRTEFIEALVKQAALLR